jgi:protein ImuB
MNRVMCVYFPNWPIQRLRHQRPELRGKPVALCQARAARKPLVLHCCRSAARLGIRPGLPVAEALAVAPHLDLHDEAPEEDRRALERLAERLGRYSPLVGLEDGPSPQSLLADITGCAPLFRGEDRLVEQASKELTEEGWHVRLASADTLAAAWALARYAKTPHVIPPGDTEQSLRRLPVAALRLSADACQRLSKLGVDSVGRLLALPRSEVPARFGSEVLRRIDQALGRTPDLILPWRPAPDIQATRRFDFPTERWDELHLILGQLMDVVDGMLQERQWGARQLECCLEFEKAPPTRLEIFLFQPSRSRLHLAALLGTRLEQVQVAEPVIGMGLRVVVAEPLGRCQLELTGAGQARNELPALIDRLSNQMGREAVTRPRLVPDPQPEYACRFQPVIEASEKSPFSPLERGAGGEGRNGAKDNPSPSPEGRGAFPLDYRPLWLMPAPARVEVIRVVPGGPPSRFRWAGTEYQVVRAWGPERIETGWWRGQDIHRDYYMVRTHVGTCFWLFLQEDGAWFLHGCFD